MGAIIVGFPSVLVAGMDILTDRLLGGASRAIAKEDDLRKSSWWWLLRSYLSGFGLPLFIAALGGVATGVVHLRDQSSEGSGSVLMLTGLAAYLLVFSQWEYVRVHHLLPTFPLLMLLAAIALVRLWEYNRTIARPLITVLLVTSATYAAAGDLHYATKPRGEATDWVRTEVPPNATIEVYTVDPQDAAIPHGMQISRYRPQSTPLDGNPSHHDELTRIEWIVNMPERCPAYIQLNYHPDFATLAPDNRDGRSQQRPPQSPRARYVYDLLAGDTYAYRVAATFGPRPPFLGPNQGSARLPELLRAGLLPWSLLNYGDDQDSGIGQYSVLLERTDSCDPDRSPPYRRHTVESRLTTVQME